MDIRQAILKAAEHIERHPQQFRFSETSQPEGTDCGSPGCALGWIGYFAGAIGSSYNAVLPMLGLSTDTQFYAALTECETGKAPKEWVDIRRALWLHNPKVCATALRAFADKHFPAAITLPDWNAMASKWTVGDSVVSQELA